MTTPAPVDQRSAVNTPPPLGARARLLPGAAAVAISQLARVKVARIPLLLVATMQSFGIVVLLRGVVRSHDAATGRAVVAGATVLVVAFVALNLLAQRLGALRGARALDYYAALPVSPAAVVLGTAASYAAFTLPGAVITCCAGAAMYGLPMAQLWVVLPVVAAAGLSLAGAGAVLGLLAPRPELATIAGQLGMTGVLFLGVIPVEHLPELVRGLRAVVPGMLAADALVDALRSGTPWGDVVVRIGATAGYGVLLLVLASVLMRRAVDR